MNQHLAPTYQYVFGDYWVLWFAESNSYSIIDKPFKTVLDFYLSANSLSVFEKYLNDFDLKESPAILGDQILNFLKDCQATQNDNENESVTFDDANRNITKHYRIHGKTITIHYDCELVLKTIHPPLAYLSIESTKDSDDVFDIYLDDSELHLFQNEKLITKVPKRNYHLLQGKFVMRLFCSIYNKDESDWIGTFHGSTISDGNTAILFIGASGSGKSTLTSLLASSGFHMLADDVSPMLADNQCLYHNPLATSVKSGAFKVLQPVLPKLDQLETITFNPNKGSIKYLSFNTPPKLSYPCKAIVLVNYQKNADTFLEPISVKSLLEVLIQDTWLSPQSEHAKQFLDWLSQLKFHQLTYSNDQEMMVVISKLFENLKETDNTLS